jgi:16S rRNA (cytidine1402-2'-O)-methyltransferase
LQAIADTEPERKVLVAREMTKSHEEFLSGTAAAILNDLATRSIIKGEFAVLVSGSASEIDEDIKD